MKYSNSLEGTVADEKWIELQDPMYTSMMNQNDKYHNCKVILEYPTADIKVSYNLPVYPEKVNNSISTNYQSTEILGRPGQISSYISTGDPTTSFQLHMHRENRLHDTNSDLDNSKNHIDQIVALIEAAQYPYMDSTSGAIHAPIVTYIFGDTTITGKQTSVSTEWLGPKIEGKYMEVMMNISVTNLTYGIRDYTHFLDANPRGFNRWDNSEESWLNKLLGVASDVVESVVDIFTGND